MMWGGLFSFSEGKGYFVSQEDPYKPALMPSDPSGRLPRAPDEDLDASFGSHHFSSEEAYSDPKPTKDTDDACKARLVAAERKDRNLNRSKASSPEQRVEISEGDGGSLQKDADQQGSNDQHISGIRSNPTNQVGKTQTRRRTNEEPNALEDAAYKQYGGGRPNSKAQGKRKGEIETFNDPSSDDAKNLPGPEFKDQFRNRPIPNVENDMRAQRISGERPRIVQREFGGTTPPPFADILAVAVPQSQLRREEIETLRRQVAAGEHQRGMRKWYFLVGTTILLFLTIGIAIGALCGSGNCSRPTTSRLAPTVPTASPTNTPTLAPESSAPTIPPIFFEERAANITSLINSVSLSTSSIQYPDQSPLPEGRAVAWLIEEDPLQLHAVDEVRIIQRYALVIFFFRAGPGLFGGQPDGDDWLGGSHECSWSGITCSQDEHITEIDLLPGGLQGDLPNDIGLLANLQVLRIHENVFQGTIPSTVSLLTSLRVLDIQKNNLGGQIPDSLATMETLRQLYLSKNSLTGTIPVALEALTRLQILYLSDNVIRGSIPAGLGDLSRLQLLGLARNRLVGGIPSSFGRMTDLFGLFIEGNFIDGTIPMEFGNLSQLEILGLSDNELTGSIPSEIGNLVLLRELLLFQNLLRGNLPSELGNLEQLQYLWANSNMLDGTIPSEIGNLSNLADFRLFENKLSGFIPTEIGRLTAMTECGLHENNLTGSIPSELHRADQLNIINLSTNNLNSTIPSDFGTLSSLTYLSVDTNDLWGTIPSELGRLSVLTALHLYNNRNLAGTVPVSLAALTNLRELSVFNCAITGSVPTELGLLTSLTYLALNGNALSGNLPASLGNLSNMVSLYLNFNQFSGELPQEYSRLSQLSLFWVYRNQLSGSLSPELAQLSQLTSLSFSTNNFSGQIPTGFSGLTKLEEASFVNNRFTGSMPFCSSFRGVIRLLWADCDEVDCPCCTGCCPSTGWNGIPPIEDPQSCGDVALANATDDQSN